MKKELERMATGKTQMTTSVAMLVFQKKFGEEISQKIIEDRNNVNKKEIPLELCLTLLNLNRPSFNREERQIEMITPL